MATFFRNALAYSGAGVIGQVCKVLQELVLRRLLPPGVLGIWNFAGVVQGFAGTFDAGTLVGAYRETALLEGAGRKEEALATRSTAFWSNLLQNAIIVLAIGGYVALFQARAPIEKLAGLAAGSFLIFSCGLIDAMTLFHQASQQYVSLSRTVVSSSILTSLVLPIGAYFGGAAGLLAAGLLGSAVQALLLLTSARIQGLGIRRYWRLSILRRLVSYGLPFRLADYPLNLFSVIDGMFVARYLGFEQLALYSTAKIIVSQSADFPARLGGVFASKLFNQLGGGRSRADLADSLLRFLAVSYMVVIPMIVLGVSCVVPLLFVHVLPNYTRTLPTLSILMFSIYFVPNTSVVRNFWLADSRLFGVAAINAVSLVGLLILGALILWGRGMSLSSVAFSVVGGYAWFFTCLMATIGREVWGWRKTLSVIASVAVSSLYVGLVLHWLTTQPEHASALVGAKVLALNLCKGVVLLSPLMLVGLWRARVLPHVRAAVTR